MVDLIPRFMAMGIDCDLLTFDGTITPFRKSLEEASVKVFDFGKGTRPYSVKNIPRLVNSSNTSTSIIWTTNDINELIIGVLTLSTA